MFSFCKIAMQRYGGFGTGTSDLHEGRDGLRECRRQFAKSVYSDALCEVSMSGFGQRSRRSINNDVRTERSRPGVPL